MKFDEITLRNYRCFETETVEFEGGVNVIYGVNGSGKSTLLEAAFFALYGADALRNMGANLDDVVTNEEHEAEVSMAFTRGGQSYTVTRTLKERGERVSQTKATLSTPDGTVEGVTNVDNRIKSLTRLDASSFLNSAFVRQGDINALIQASPDERKRLIDKLLQLGVLDEYKERASDIRVGVGRVRDARNGVLENKVGERDALADEDPEARLESIQDQIDDKQAERQDRIDERDDIKDAIDAAKETRDTQQSLQDDLESVTDEIAEIESDIEGLQDRRDGLVGDHDDAKTAIQDTQEDIREELNSTERPVVTTVDTELEQIRTRRDTFEAYLADVKSDVSLAKQERESTQADIDRREDALADANTTIGDKRGAIDEKKERLETEQVPERDELQATIEDLDEQIEAYKETLSEHDVTPGDIDELQADAEQRRDALVEKKSDLNAKRTSKESERDRYIDLREQGKCPECGQDVEHAPHVEKIDTLEEAIENLADDIEAVEDEIADVDAELDTLADLEDIASDLQTAASEKHSKKDLLDKQESTIQSAKDDIDSLEADIDGLIADIHEHAVERRRLQSKRDGLDARIATLETQRDALAWQRNLLDGVIDDYEDISTLRDERDSAKKDISHVDDLIESKQERLDALEEKHDSIEDEFDADALETAISNLKDYAKRRDDLSGEIDDIDSDLAELQEEKGEIKNDVRRLETLRSDVKTLQKTVDALTDLYDQMERIEAMYDQLRTDLRQRNIKRLEELLNELFDLTYQNESYDKIELDASYNATVIEKSGSEINPEKLSGGESALFNLSLRAAIYQLLVEGVGESDMMPPLILDEPTAHLDEGHINKIDTLVERMRKAGVEQTIVVSHTEEVIDSASHRIEVSQPAASNRSDAVADTQRLI